MRCGRAAAGGSAKARVTIDGRSPPVEIGRAQPFDS